MGLALLVLVLHAVFVAPFTLRVTRVEIPISDLGSELDGYVIALISDLHVGLPGSLRQARRAFAAVADEKPHLLVHLGDYGYSFEWWRPPSRVTYRRTMRLLSPELRRASAPEGVIAVLGNHDYYYDAHAVRRWLEGCGIHVLVNAHRLIQRGDARLAIVGIDDAKEGQIEIAEGLRGVPDDVPRILLSHNPDGVFEVRAGHRFSVVLSGHTHGGQIVLPWYGAPVRFCHVCGRHSASGWVPNDYAPLFVTSGVGGMIPFRINAPPEIVMVTLRARAGQQPA